MLFVGVSNELLLDFRKVSVSPQWLKSETDKRPILRNTSRIFNDIPTCCGKHSLIVKVLVVFKYLVQLYYLLRQYNIAGFLTSAYFMICSNYHRKTSNDFSQLLKNEYVCIALFLIYR